MSITVKAYLECADEKTEIRRFPVDHSVASNFGYLSEKLFQVFPSLARARIDIRWKDAENDYVLISSDDELVEALGFVNDGILRLYIRRTDAGPTKDVEGVLHTNITCDGCDGPVRGKRFKCTTCPDYDLCEACENKNVHPEHSLLRITAPGSDWRAHIPPPPYGGWQAQGPSAPGPFPGPVPHGPFQGPPACGPACGPAGFPPAFGFPFMHQGPHWMRRWMRYHGGEGSYREEEPCCAKKARKMEQKMEGAEQANEGEQAENRETEAPFPNREEYLRCIGNSVAALLDPLGIDVEVNVARDGPAGRCSAGGCERAFCASTSASDQPTSSGTRAGDTVEMTNSETGESSSASTSRDAGESSTSRQADNGDSDWTMIGSDSAAGALLDHALQLSAEQQHSQQIEETTAQLRDMGFGDEDGWLTRLVTSKNGDISKVLDALQPHK